MEIKTKNSPDCPVKDLLYIIRQEDIEHLRNALLDVIDRFQPGGEIYLYEQGYGIYDTNQRGFSPKLLACRNADNNCTEKASQIQVSADSDTIQFDGFSYLPTEDFVQVFTVESERSSRGLLITVNENFIDESYIYTLLSAYNHQVYLLRNKDTDSLTGLYNRQSFDSYLGKLHKNFSSEKRQHDEPCQCCFALLDIDFFKSVNDKYGHVYGDEVLLLFANIMKETFRDEDMLFRYGGEEFAILLHNIDLQTAQSVFERFRNKIAAFNFPMENTVTTSIGYTEFSDKIPLTSIIERADKALYYSKGNGRNMTSCFEFLLQQEKLQESAVEEGEIELF